MGKTNSACFSNEKGLELALHGNVMVVNCKPCR